MISDKRHRFPPQIIAHTVWLYVRFNLGLREVEEMPLERGIDVSDETVRRRTRKFGSPIAQNLRRRLDGPRDGRWVRLIECHRLPKRIITDKFRSYGATKREVAPNLDHWSPKASTIARGKATCHFNLENKRCKASGQPANYSSLPQFTPPREFASPFHPGAVPP